MVTDLKALEARAQKDVKAAKTLKELDGVFRLYLGKKGELTLLLKSIQKLKKTERTQAGKGVNNLKDTLTLLFKEQRDALQTKNYKLQTDDWLDITMPGRKIELGHLHPLTQVQRKAQ